MRQEAKKLAENRSSDMILTDGPPGVGCPVIAFIGGAAAVLIVAEPTVSGIHDMERVAQLAAHYRAFHLSALYGGICGGNVSATHRQKGFSFGGLLADVLTLQ